MTVVFASEKPTEASDQPHHLTQGGGVSGGLVRCATIQAACHSSGSNTTSQGRLDVYKRQVEGLNGVGGVDRTADVIWVVKKGDHPLPVP